CPVSLNRQLVEQMAKPQLTTFKNPMEWNNGPMPNSSGRPTKMDFLSRMPEDCLREVFSYLHWFDIESMRQVSQTM
ncbi:hypothetical protein PFISCL1PPCAC_18211, partial [Pristionchus fissidentatus]